MIIASTVTKDAQKETTKPERNEPVLGVKMHNGEGMNLNMNERIIPYIVRSKTVQLKARGKQEHQDDADQCTKFKKRKKLFLCLMHGHHVSHEHDVRRGPLSKVKGKFRNIYTHKVQEKLKACLHTKQMTYRDTFVRQSGGLYGKSIIHCPCDDWPCSVTLSCTAFTDP